MGAGFHGGFGATAEKRAVLKAGGFADDDDIQGHAWKNGF